MRTTQLCSAALLVLGLVTMSGLAGCVAQESEDEPSVLTSHEVTEANLDQFCTEASVLASRDPKAAIELIDSVRAPAKEAAELKASPLTEEQVALLDACADVRLSAAAQVAKKAVKAAEAEKAAALEKAAKEKKDKANKTAAETIAVGWADITEHWFVPLTGVGILAGALIVALLVLSRWVSISPPVRHGIVDADRRRRAGGFGFFLILAGSLELAGVFASIGKDNTIDAPLIFWLVVAVVSAVSGMLLFAGWLASRLRLSVDVYGSGEKAGDKDEWATSRVVNLLSSLAGTPARGIEVPIGTDVQVLKGETLPTTNANVVLSVLQAVIEFLFLGTPWRVIVRTDGDKAATVTVTHNGETVDKTVIDVSRFDLPEKIKAADAIHYFAAAVVILALRKRNPGFEALSGATSWKSIGLQALAVSTYKLGDPELEQILEDAVEADAGNLVAVFAFENARNRKETSQTKLSEYAALLNEQLEAIHRLPQPEGHALDVELRVRLLLALITINIRATPPDAGKPPAPEPTNARTNIVDLILLLEKSGADSEFHKDLREQAGLAFVDITSPQNGGTS